MPLREIGEKKKKEERRRRKKQHWGRGAARVLPGQGWTVASSVRATGVPKAGAPPGLRSLERERVGGRWFLPLIKTAATSKGGSEGPRCL